MPILSPETVEFLSRGPEQTRRLGVRIGTLLKPGDVICLSGDLGAGKTTLVPGIAQGWGSLDPVSSPTFVLVNSYRKPGGQSLYHLDAYRLENALEAESLDLDVMIEHGPLVVEWPERIDEALPADRLWVDMEWIADEKRRLVFHPQGDYFKSLLEKFRRWAFGGR